MQPGQVGGLVGLGALAAILLSGPGAGWTSGGADEIVARLTSPQPGQRLQGRVEIAGYAADRRSEHDTGLNERDIAIYLHAAPDPEYLLEYAWSGRNSPDAAVTLGPQFAQAGFQAFWDTCAFPAGPNTLGVWVSSVVVPGARHSASVDVTLAPCLPGTVLYQDDFGWRRDGIDTIRLERPGSRRRILTRSFADFAGGIDARCRQSAPDCRVELAFREQRAPDNTRTAYVFHVSPTDGTFGLAYHPPGAGPTEAIPLIGATASPVIQRATDWNRVAVIADKTSLRLFINGEQVAEAHDERRPWGQLAWAAHTDAPRRAVEVEFDDIVVATVGPLDALTPVLRSGHTGPTWSASHP